MMTSPILDLVREYEVRNNPRVLITGISGQDGSYMAEWLLHLGYEVHGVVRRSSVDNLYRIRHIEDRLFLHTGDLFEFYFIVNLIKDYQFDIVYNFAAQSHVHTSFIIPNYTDIVNYQAVFELLFAIKEYSPHTRFYQASTSEMFGNSPAPQSLKSNFDPQSPYAESKLLSHGLVEELRESHGLYAVSGVLFNHESSRRGLDFVTRKITKAVGDFYLGKRDKNTHPLRLGNIHAKRDWGFAPEYVIMIHDKMTRDDPEDFVLGTGKTHSVEEFLKASFDVVDLDWKEYTVYDDSSFIRPKEVNLLQAEMRSSEIPVIRFEDIVEIMVEHDRGVHYIPYQLQSSDAFNWEVG